MFYLYLQIKQMKIIEKKNDLYKYLTNISNLGFVPTMGALHGGHLSLIRESQKICKKTLVSIFVNSTQFNNKKDFLSYPRNIKKDLKILKKLKVDYVFIPKKKEIYKKRRFKKIIIKKNLNILCGKHRKGHFEGVIDIIDRFLNLINPKYMFLGQKDFQQQFLIKEYVKNKFKIKIKSCQTVRDNNKIALSSRNKLLNEKELKIVSKITNKLILLRKNIKKNINLFKKVKNIKKELINSFNIKLEYLEILNKKNLSKNIRKNNFKIFIAYYIGKVRLIDNF